MLFPCLQSILSESQKEAYNMWEIFSQSWNETKNEILELKAQEDKYLNEGIEVLEFAHTFKSLIRERKEEGILSIGISNKDINLTSFLRILSLVISLQA